MKKVVFESVNEYREHKSEKDAKAKLKAILAAAITILLILAAVLH